MFRVFGKFIDWIGKYNSWLKVKWIIKDNINIFIEEL